MGASEQDQAGPQVWADGNKSLRLVRHDGSSSVVLLRRITPSYANDIRIAAGVVQGGVGELAKFQELLVRWAIVGAHDLTDADTLEAVAFATEKTAVGDIASREVYDALGGLDVDAILGVSQYRLSVQRVETLLKDAWKRFEESKREAKTALLKLEESLAEVAKGTNEIIAGKLQPPPNGFIGGGNTLESASEPRTEASA